jgi:multidrug efflux pump subunit AcrB
MSRYALFRIPQLRKLQLNYSPNGGSSKGVRSVTFCPLLAHTSGVIWVVSSIVCLSLSFLSFSRSLVLSLCVCLNMSHTHTHTLIPSLSRLVSSRNAIQHTHSDQLTNSHHSHTHSHFRSSHLTVSLSRAGSSWRKSWFPSRLHDPRR